MKSLSKVCGTLVVMAVLSACSLDPSKMLGKDDGGDLKKEYGDVYCTDRVMTHYSDSNEWSSCQVPNKMPNGTLSQLITSVQEFKNDNVTPKRIGVTVTMKKFNDGTIPVISLMTFKDKKAGNYPIASCANVTKSYETYQVVYDCSFIPSTVASADYRLEYIQIDHNCGRWDSDKSSSLYVAKRVGDVIGDLDLSYCNKTYEDADWYSTYDYEKYSTTYYSLGSYNGKKFTDAKSSLF